MIEYETLNQISTQLCIDVDNLKEALQNAIEEIKEAKWKLLKKKGAFLVDDHHQSGFFDGGIDMARAVLDFLDQERIRATDDSYEQRCRICGCTHFDCSKCVEKIGFPCHWIEEDLCSACYKKKR